MAGKPKRQAMVHALTALAAEEVDDGDAHLEYLVKWTEAGNTMVQLAKLIREKTGEEISTTYVTRYFTDRYPEQYGVRMTAARSLGAFAMVEQAQEIGDDLAEQRGVEKEEIAVAKLRIDTRLWTAERFNRKELGAPKDSVNVSVSVGGLHLDALRTRATAKLTAESREKDTELVTQARGYIIGETANVAESPAEEAEYEVIEQEPVL